MTEQNIKARINGVDVVWLKDDDGSGPLAPPHHLNKQGHVTLKAVLGPEDSYAHVFANGVIMRYGEIIGTVDDLEERL